MSADPLAVLASLEERRHREDMNLEQAYALQGCQESINDLIESVESAHLGVLIAYLIHLIEVCLKTTNKSLHSIVSIQSQSDRHTSKMHTK